MLFSHSRCTIHSGAFSPHPRPPVSLCRTEQPPAKMIRGNYFPMIEVIVCNLYIIQSYASKYINEISISLLYVVFLWLAEVIQLKFSHCI